MNARALSLPTIADEIRAGLLAFPKRLPPTLFYDERGSALFEQITDLPEYYLTATERAIFEQSATEMIEQAGEGLTVVELGAGSASKTVLLLNALLRKQAAVEFYPVDVSSAALTEANVRLSAELPAVSVHPTVADYTRGLQFMRRIRGRKLILYIGSSIGNFEPFQASALLSTLRRSMSPGDSILLGTDMRKSPDVLLPAYDDASGVTAEFNKNILVRLNREFRANFDLRQFQHRVVWNDRESRIEMHLESAVQQSVIVADLGLSVFFAEGERIHTENSYKFTKEMVESIANNAQLLLERTWTDDRGWFTVHLLRR